MTYEVGSVLQWMNTNFKNAGWMFKIDDDTILNPFVFTNIFEPKFIEQSSKIPLVIGSALVGNPVRTEFITTQI